MTSAASQTAGSRTPADTRSAWRRRRATATLDGEYGSSTTADGLTSESLRSVPAIKRTRYERKCPAQQPGKPQWSPFVAGPGNIRLRRPTQVTKSDQRWAGRSPVTARKSEHAGLGQPVGFDHVPVRGKEVWPWLIRWWSSMTSR